MTRADYEAVRTINIAAFGGGHEATLIERLRDDGLVIASLVAVDDEAGIIGHILFSRLTIHMDDSVMSAVALAPAAVLPEHQRRGIGSSLIRDGLRACQSASERVVIVVGHPSYYPRFGFSATLVRRLQSPWSGAAFMALELEPGALAGITGQVKYPAAFFNQTVV